MNKNKSTKETTNRKKIGPFSEPAYFIAVVLLAFGTMLLTKADFGLSMVVAPAYLLSLKVDFLTFGMAEYLIQGLLLIIFCLVMRQFKWKWILSFATAFFYGLVLDGCFWLFQWYEPTTLPLRIAAFIPGVLLATLGVAFFLKTYLPVEVYELFVKGVNEKFGFPIGKTKICFDVTMLLIAIAMSFILFHRLEGIGIGTVICTFLNGILIQWWGNLIMKIFDFTPIIKKMRK